MRGYNSSGSMPHPGDLRHRITIGMTENIINENGYPEPQETVICQVWASANDAGNQYYLSADAQNAENVVNFTIRYRSDIQPGMWVLFQKKKWKIEALTQYSYQKSYLVLKASVAEGVN